MASILKVDTIQDQSGNNIINESADTITIGASGDTITIPSGATLANSGIVTGFESTGIDDNATSTAITIDSSQNVGIGTASLSLGKLTVSGSGDQTLVVESTNADSQIRLRIVGEGDVYVRNRDGDLTFENTSERMRINSSGNVGIGTSSPSVPLDVNGITRTANAYSLGYAGVPGSTSAFGAGTISTDGNWGMYFRATTGAAVADFAWVNGAGTERMRIDSSGNVGIGTSSPSARLETKNATDGSTFAFQATNDNDHEIVQIGAQSDGDGYLTVHGQGVSTNIKVQLHSDGDSYFTGGNVGIGTSSPDQLLHISAGSGLTRMKFTRNNTAGTNNSFGELNFENSVGTTLASIKAISISGNTDSGFVFGTGSGNTEAMRINSVGSLLVGATTAGASEKLRLYSPNTTNATFLFNFGNANGAVFQAENSGRLKTGTQSQSPYNYAVTGRDVYVSSGGLIGYLSSIRDSKTNIENISDVSWLYQLNPVSFNYKVQDEKGNYTEEAEADKFYGLIAEEVEPINSDICFYKNNNPEDGLAGVDYKKLYAPMIKALQEQQTKIETLEARITALENK